MNVYTLRRWLNKYLHFSSAVSVLVLRALSTVVPGLKSLLERAALPFGHHGQPVLEVEG